MRVVFNFDDDYEENNDPVKTEEVDSKVGRFNKVFNKDRIIDAFANSCAAMMFISTVTDIPLDEVLDMCTTKMKEELNAEDTKSLREVGKLINGLINAMGEEN